MGRGVVLAALLFFARITTSLVERRNRMKIDLDKKSFDLQKHLPESMQLDPIALMLYTKYTHDSIVNYLKREYEIMNEAYESYKTKVESH